MPTTIHRTSSYLLLLCALLCFLVLAWRYGALVAFQPVGLDSDEFTHIVPAYDLYLKTQGGDLTGFVARVFEEGFYPPLHPLVVSVAFALFGPSTQVARLVSVALFAIAGLVLALATARVLKRNGVEASSVVRAALLALVLHASSTTVLLDSSLCMMEALGLLLVSALLFVLSGVSPLSRSAALVLGVLFSALLLTKYTFLVLVLPGLLLALPYVPKEWGDYWLLLRRTALFFAIPLVAFSFWWVLADREQISRFLFDYPMRGHTLGIWEILYYPLIIPREFLALPWLICLLLPLAFWGAVRCWEQLAARAATLFFICALITLGLVAERTPRHLVIVVPCVWMLAGVGWGELERRLPRLQALVSLAAWLALALLGWAALNSQPALESALRQTMEERPGWNEFNQKLAEALQGRGAVRVAYGETLPSKYDFFWRRALLERRSAKEIRNETVYLSPLEITALSSDEFKEPSRTLVIIAPRSSGKPVELIARIKRGCEVGCSYFSNRAGAFLVVGGAS